MGILKAIRDFFTGSKKESAPTKSTPKPTAPAANSLEARRKHYETLFDSLVIPPYRQLVVKRQYDKVMKNIAQYLEASKLTGVPAEFIGFLHSLEANCDLNDCLHNGEPWNRKTRYVPKGRGPFKSFVESCVDALKIKDYHTKKAWGIAEMLYRAEMYNGPGYIKRGDRSPYLWGFSNHEIKGKYIQDHQYDPDAINDQVGFATLLKYHYQVTQQTPPTPDPKQEPTAPPAKDEPFIPKSYEVEGARDLNPKLDAYITRKILANPANQIHYINRDPHALFILAGEAMEGIKEEGGNNKGPLVSLIQDTIGGTDPWAWCMSTVQSAIAYAERYTGYKSSVVGTEGVSDCWDRSPAKCKLKDPKPGTAVCWKKAKSWEGHTGIVKKVAGVKMAVTEGNTSEEGFSRDGDVVRERARERGGYTVGLVRFNELGFLDPWPEISKV